MATGDEDLDQLRANESGGSVTNVVGRLPVMQPVWSGCERATTDRARTGLVQRPYGRSARPPFRLRRDAESRDLYCAIIRR
jgi:hypothetical protein